VLLKLVHSYRKNSTWTSFPKPFSLRALTSVNNSKCSYFDENNARDLEQDESGWFPESKSKESDLSHSTFVSVPLASTRAASNLSSRHTCDVHPEIVHLRLQRTPVVDMSASESLRESEIKLSLLAGVTKLDGKDDYFNWRMSIQALLTAFGLWDLVTDEDDDESDEEYESDEDEDHEDDEEDDDEDDEEADRLARYLLFMSMSAKEQRRFNDAKTGSALLKAIDSAYSYVDLAHVEELRDELYNTPDHKFDRPIRHHLNGLLAKRDQLLAHGGTIEEKDFCRLILFSLPDEYEGARRTFTADENKLTVADVEKGLRLEEAILRVRARNHAGKRPAVSKKDAGKKSGGNKPADATKRLGVGKKNDGNKKACFRCGKQGHFVKDCRTSKGRRPKKPKATAERSESATLPAGVKCLRCKKPGHFKKDCSVPMGPFLENATANRSESSSLVGDVGSDDGFVTLDSSEISYHTDEDF
jgi:hypothetical protein